MHVCGLGDCVNTQHRRPFEPANARHNDHRSIFPRGHFRQNHIAQPKIAAHIAVHHFGKRVVGKVRQRTIIRIDRGIADQDVDLAPQAARLIHQMLQIFFLADVAGDGRNIQPIFLKLRRHLLAFVRLAAGDHYLGTRLRQRLRDRQSDSFGGTSDNRHLPRQIK